MEFIIIGDSCADLLKEDRNKEYFDIAPLSIQVDDYNIIDDETFDQIDFLKKVANSPNCPKSSCPTPEVYNKMFEKADECYVVTLSSELSGSYNSAVLAKNLYLEENPSKKIYIFNSRSASSGETAICKKIEELKLAGKKFEEVIEETEEFINNLRTFFVLETLEALRKNGRLSNVKALVANVLNIKPIMGGDKNGMIYQLGQARGINKALLKLIEIICNECSGFENKILYIAHCNCADRAKWVSTEFKKKCNFKDIVIVDTAGISSLYASDGGIVVAF